MLQAVHGCTTAEIGNRLGLGGAAVDALLFRARSGLRDVLAANAQPIACARTEALATGQLAHELDCNEQAAPAPTFARVLSAPRESAAFAPESESRRC